MAQEEKKYLSESGLQRLVEIIKAGFARLTHTHELSDITDYEVDAELSQNSENPVQNKVIKSSLDGKVPTTRTVNGKPLDANITLNASDVGAATPTDVTNAKNAVQTNLTQHIDNGDIHFSSEERTKLSGIAAGAEENVQSDWNVTDTTSDAYIKNKPSGAGTNLGLVKSGGDVTISNGVITVKDDSHNHVISNIDNLQSSLDTKVPTSRTVNGKSLSEDITLGASDVGAATPTQVNTVQTNLNTHISDESVHFTETERTKLSGIAEGAQKNTVTGVKGSSESTYRTGNINITKANIGLSNVNNTSDANKPVSTAQQAALDGHNTNVSAHNDIRLLIEDLNTKLMNFLDLGTDESTGKEVIDSVSELVSLYEENADLISSITTSKVNVSDIIDNLTTASTSKVLSANQGVEIKKLIDTLQTAVNGKSDSGHTHDSRYYTESEVDTKLSGKANTSHGNHVPSTETANNAKFLRNDNTWQTVTPENIGAAKSSHGTHVSYSTTAPVMDGTASVGSASTVARSDHKHPTDTSRASKTEFDTHTSDTTKHITSTERTNWNAAKTHADSTHAPVDAQKNQNAFSNIKVGSTTISADNATDTLELVGSNVTITPDATNDKVTIGVAAGTTSQLGIVKLENSTSSTSTTTAATPNSVKSAYDLANTAKTNAANAQTKADSAYTLANSKVDSLSDLGITATATELNYMDGVTSNVQTQLDGKAPSSHTSNKSNPHGVTLSQLGVTASSTELNRVKGVTSDVQTQLNAKAIIKTLTNEDLNSVVKEGFYNAGGGNSVTNKPSGVDHFGMIVTHNASGTYHTQILMGSDGKQWRRTCTNSTWGNWSVDKLTDTTYSAAGSSLGLVKSGGDVTISSGVITVNDDSHNHTIANVDNLQSSLDSKQATITGGASTITGSNLTANRALISNGSGKVAVSDVTNTELGYLDGVTSSIQAQLDGKSGTGHTHKYAGSSSTGGAANKVANKLAIKLNDGTTEGTNLFTFDGSASKTLNITPSSIGAVPITILTSGVDANTLTTTGYYILKNASNTNVPREGNAIVISNFNVGTPYQIFMHDATFKIYYRNYQSSAWTNWTDSLSNNITGNASTATKLTTSAGSAAKPVYFSDGKPVACTYELNKTVPSNAVFTDTNNKVTQNAAITTNGNYPVIIGNSTATTAETNAVNKTSTLTYNPSTKELNAGSVKIGGTCLLKADTTNECIDFVFS